MDVFAKDVGYGITGQVALSMPGKACLHCMNVLRPDLLAAEVANYGAVGSRPQVIWPNGVLASTAVAIMMQLIVPWHEDPADVALLEYDGNENELRVSSSLEYLQSKVCSHFNAP